MFESLLDLSLVPRRPLNGAFLGDGILETIVMESSLKHFDFQSLLSYRRGTSG